MGMLCVEALRAVLLEGRRPANAVAVACPAVSGYGSHRCGATSSACSCGRPLPADADDVGALRLARRARTSPPPQAEHEAFCALLEEAGAEVVVSEHDPGNPDAIYVYDPVLVGDDGAVLLRPGKEGRRGEPEATVASARGGGRPVVGRGWTLPATVEGGDTVWLDHDTLLVGHRLPHERGRRSRRSATRSPASR